MNIRKEKQSQISLENSRCALIKRNLGFHTVAIVSGTAVLLLTPVLQKVLISDPRTLNSVLCIVSHVSCQGTMRHNPGVSWKPLSIKPHNHPTLAHQICQNYTVTLQITPSDSYSPCSISTLPVSCISHHHPQLTSKVLRAYLTLFCISEELLSRFQLSHVT